jgi:hypothetical protein
VVEHAPTRADPSVWAFRVAKQSVTRGVYGDLDLVLREHEVAITAEEIMMRKVHELIVHGVAGGVTEEPSSRENIRVRRISLVCDGQRDLAVATNCHTSLRTVRDRDFKQELFLDVLDFRRVLKKDICSVDGFTSKQMARLLPLSCSQVIGERFILKFGAG